MKVVLKTTAERTRIFKGRDGWEARTNETGAGWDWKISTHKRDGGKVGSTAQAGKLGTDSGFETFACSLMQDPFLTLVTETARCTENSIRDLHFKALAIFDQLREDDKLPKNNSATSNETNPDRYEVKKGQICFFDSINNGMQKYIIYNVLESGIFGKTFEYVNPENLSTGSTDHLRPFTEKFGIGTYYNEGEIFTDMEALDNMVIEAKEKERNQAKQREADRTAKAKERAENIEIGKKLVTIPANAQAVIVANLREDTSNPYEDYRSARTIDTVFLAYSTHTRDLFTEMRKATLNCNIDEVRAYADPEHGKDHKEKYSMGRGYYVGHDYSYDGWEIRKTQMCDSVKESIYIASAQGKYFCEVNPPSDPSEDLKPIETDGLIIAQYNEKAGVIYGDTKPHKDELKALNCRFNPRLTLNGEHIIGWIFPLKNIDTIKKALDLK